MGLHAVIEKLLEIPELRQLWFLDDGILRGKSPHVRQAAAVMSSELAKINLRVNCTKCEVYLPTNAAAPAGFDNIPIVRDRDVWTYLGSPLSEQTTAALNGAANRVSQATSKIAAFAKTHPKQAFHLLRATAGACRIEYLLQTMPRTPIIEQLVSTCSADMRTAYAAILRQPAVDDFTWTHATIPQRLGGLGLRDPKTIIDTARVASLVNVTERALGEPQIVTSTPRLTRPCRTTWQRWAALSAPSCSPRASYKRR